MDRVKSDQLLLSSLNNQEDLHAASFEYQSIFLSSIILDATNPRFLPVIFISDEDARLYSIRKLSKQQIVKHYGAENHVLIGKACIINCFEFESAGWRKANQGKASILELGNNISVSELIQAPTVYPVDEGQFQILTGHRRFCALVYANGYGSAAQFKVYDSRPLLTKIKQFQENASREDLPQHGKLIAFLDAITELDILNTARKKVGLKKLTVREAATQLGISKGAYDNYNVLTRYECVREAYEAGLSYSFVKTKKIVLDVEAGYKQLHDKTGLNTTDKKQISREIKAKLSKTTGRSNKLAGSKAFKLKPSTPGTFKTLLSTNIMALDTGINWSKVDWQDYVAVANTMSAVIDFLEKDQ
ncbi:hypothetical protein [Thalassomonas haliotis]|uniref:ParB/Sulfiredoxin domain-containing protein n=1 Tax=Thalassomonas haliotis TaxID=485448 RepID=A0ABY7VE71_9GAMM|nr:hypothetical protein [Thalassomonas haliotis]WDE11988.1 hypothetical protein H3N35_00400 [Thalassomonas haliotis]